MSPGGPPDKPLPGAPGWRPSWLGFVGTGLLVAMLAVVLVQARQYAMLRQAFDPGSDTSALSLFEAARVRYEAIDDRGAIGRALLKKGIAYNYQGQPFESMDLLVSALEYLDPRVDGDRSALRELGVDTKNFHSMDTPIFEILEGDGEKKSVTPIFTVSDILAKVLEISAKGVQIKRFKGLGEMNAKQLFDTTMDPETRQFLRVRLDEDNAVEADRMFDILMGDVVEPRKRFIEDNALNVRTVDV